MARALAVASRASSNPGVRSISTNSARLSSKFVFRQFIVAVINVSFAATLASVARKSSVSSNSPGFRLAVPPSRIIRAVIAVRPGMSAGSSDEPPLNVIETVISGNSCDGAKYTAVPSGSTRRNVAAAGGSKASGSNVICSGRAGMAAGAANAAFATGAATATGGAAWSSGGTPHVGRATSTKAIRAAREIDWRGVMGRP